MISNIISIQSCLIYQKGPNLQSLLLHIIFIILFGRVCNKCTINVILHQISYLAQIFEVKLERSLVLIHQLGYTVQKL